MASMNETALSLIQSAIDRRETTVGHLARIAGCSRQHVYNVLSRKRQPTLELVEKLLGEINAEIVVKTNKSKKKSSTSVDSGKVGR